MKKIGIIVTIICAVALTAAATSLIFLSYQSGQKINPTPIGQGICKEQSTKVVTTAEPATTTENIASTTAEKLKVQILKKYELQISTSGTNNKLGNFDIEKTSTGTVKCFYHGPDAPVPFATTLNCSDDNYLIAEKDNGKKFKVKESDFFDIKDYDNSCNIKFVASDKNYIYVKAYCLYIGNLAVGTLIKYNPASGNKEDFLDNILNYYQHQNLLLVQTLDFSNQDLWNGATNFILIDLQNQTKIAYGTNWSCEDSFECSQIVFSTSGPNWADAIYILPKWYYGQNSEIYQFTKNGFSKNEATDLKPDEINSIVFWN